MGKIFYDDPIDSEENKSKVSKLLVDELDSTGSSSFLPHFLECDSVLYEDFSEVDTLTSTDNEDKVFNPGILIHENLYEVTNQVTSDKNVKKKSSSNASPYETMSSPNHSTSDIEDDFSSMNILNYTSVSSDYFPASSGIYTPTPPQIFEIGKSSSKIHLKHHENQIKDILNYLEELSFLRFGKMEEDNKLKTELEKVRSQIIKLQRKQFGNGE
ncbi:hypothetical protein Tco_0733697 [Tanacetum coccineum]